VGVYTIPASSTFPQTTNNRTRTQMVDDVLDYVGGRDRSKWREVAGRSIDSAIRQFNTIAWRFNRTQQDITLVNDTSDYTLTSTVRNPLRCRLLDTNSVPVHTVHWQRFEDETKFTPSRLSVTSTPARYTIRNVHLNGVITFLPRIGTVNVNRPTARVDFHKRIVVPASAALIDVPTEVEEAIVDEAVAITIAKVRTFVEGRDARVLSRTSRERVEWEWRDYPDSATHME